MMPVDRTQGLPRGGAGPVLDRMVEMRVDPKPMTIFTFGFGSDHNEDMLRSLAGTTNGLYYYLLTWRRSRSPSPTAWAVWWRWWRRT